MELVLYTLLKPFVALVILVPSLMLSRWLYKRMPDSKFKRALFAPLPGHKARVWD